VNPATALKRLENRQGGAGQISRALQHSTVAKAFFTHPQLQKLL
jgi:hypothetical protein